MCAYKALLLFCLGLASASALCADRSSAVPLFRAWVDAYRTDHFYTTNYGEFARALDDGYEPENDAGLIFRGAEPGTVPFYRLWHVKNDDHFYTTSADERDAAIRGSGYTDEGVAGYVYPGSACPGTVPLYRMFKGGKGHDHFYTTDAAEAKRFVSKYGYADEGIAAWIYPV